MLNRLKALCLLSECTGDDIWSIELCEQRSIPPAWIDELSDGFESGFQHDSQTIYREGRPTNQYQGVRDIDLARRLGEYLGVDLAPLEARAQTRAQLVFAIQQAIEEQ